MALSEPRSDRKDGEVLEDDLGLRICVCMKVHTGTLERAIDAGARTVELLREATRAGTGCGTCRGDLEELLRQRLGGRP